MLNTHIFLIWGICKHLHYPHQNLLKVLLIYNVAPVSAVHQSDSVLCVCVYIQLCVYTQLYIQLCVCVYIYTCKRIFFFWLFFKVIVLHS